MNLVLVGGKLTSRSSKLFVPTSPTIQILLGDKDARGMYWGHKYKVNHHPPTFFPPPTPNRSSYNKYGCPDTHTIVTFVLNLPLSPQMYVHHSIAIPQSGRNVLDPIILALNYFPILPSFRTCLICHHFSSLLKSTTHGYMCCSWSPSLILPR